MAAPTLPPAPPPFASQGYVTPQAPTGKGRGWAWGVALGAILLSIIGAGIIASGTPSIEMSDYEERLTDLLRSLILTIGVFGAVIVYSLWRLIAAVERRP